MKTTLAAGAALLFLSQSCVSTPERNFDPKGATAVEADNLSTLNSSPSPTPNTEIEPRVIPSITEQDPEGDIAPMVPCRAGEIGRRQSGKIVCTIPDSSRSGSTMTGR